MEIKGIDVSAWNGKIDWKTVADYGMGFAVLRITEKGNVVDSSFEFNYKGCLDNKIPVGVYKYSYATTLTQVEEEANVVVKTLNKRKLDLPVFLDIEDKCQENLSSATMMQFIDMFKNIVEKAGYKFGIYTGTYWYNAKLPEGAKKYDCWLASYPSMDNGSLQERLRPKYGIGWQYSSKAVIPGIPSKVDRNVFYKDYTKEIVEDKKEEMPMGKITKEQAIDALIATAKNEVGYLEKKSNSQLDSKTANAGSANYTKYWRDLKPSWNGQAWCAVFVSWCMAQTFGLETAKKLLKHPTDFPYVYCPTLGARFTKYANPEKGDVVIFYRNGTFAHTGLVTRVEGDRFWTIEGNTSGGSTIIANGGGVCEKNYYNSNLPGTKFCRPDYSIVTSINKPDATPAPEPPSSPITKPLNKLTKWEGTVTATSLNVRTQPSTDASTCSFSPLKKGTKINVCDVINDWYYISYSGKYGFVSGKYVSKIAPDTPKEPHKPKYEQWVGSCIKQLVIVYKSVTGTTRLPSYSRLASGNLVDVLDECGDRYKVKIAGKFTGYVSMYDLENSNGKYPKVGKVKTNGDTLNLRKSPVTGDVVTEIPNGSDLVVVGSKKAADGSTWYKVKYKKKEGYVSAEYAKLI